VPELWTLDHVESMSVFRIILVAFALTAAGCSRAHVTIDNKSGLTLSNLVISGLPYERRADTLTSLSTWTSVTPYWGEAMKIQLSFDCAGKSYTNQGAAEFRSAPLGICLTVHSNMTVFVSKAD
jgi:hypothetical protein